MRFTITFFICLSAWFCGSSQHLILPGSNPDPSVVKIGDKYWASTTSSNWFPAFPLLYSTDLITWKQQGYIFKELPAWADYYFWAPEMTYDSGRVYVYYTAHKKGGNLCLAVASADRPEGPYRDHGPIICQDAGSIDGFPIRDTTGKLFIVWKEDANSIGAPTPIWASQINEERTALVGEKIELFRNQEQWERELVEGVSMIKHGEYYYAFYAAAGCCGSGCSYITGVARSKNILGPWEKYNKNPILTDTENWICKGHGTPIEKDGKFYFLYHGYDRRTNAFTGREGLLQEFVFTADGWIQFKATPQTQIKRFRSLTDYFNGQVLNDNWQWTVFKNVKYQLLNGNLHLKALPGVTGSYLVQKPLSGNYTATTIVSVNGSTASAGLGAIGDEKNMIAVMVNHKKLETVVYKGGKKEIVHIKDITAGDKVHLQMRIIDRFRISFFYSLDGILFTPLNPQPLNGAFLPPWDNPFRIGLIAKGSPDEEAIFESFTIVDGITSLPPIADETAMPPIHVVLLFIAFVLMLVVIYLLRKKIRAVYKSLVH
jgi:xylan 1,4-beta-xylosidase